MFVYKYLYGSLILIFFSYYNVKCDNKNDKIIDVDFTIKKVSNEYLVIFKNYYWSHTRIKYIGAALNRQNVSYTSWFLDAFNYAMFRKINVLNLSIGGPDFMDKPFVDKVLELSANKVIMVSAIGNDGPLYGTLNNPADQSDVIGVGGINSDENVAKFSSRGMTTWEIPMGYGRLKPDIVTYGSQVKGSNLGGGCRSLSGTSVASPVVAGAVALLLSGAPNKSEFINPSSVKQIIIEGATRLPNNNMFEQGNGKLNIIKSMELLLSYEPKITLSPPYVDYREPYMWPYSSQPLYCGSMQSIINVTILNGISVRGTILNEPIWHPYIDKHGELMDVNITYSSVLWPWTGWMAVKISINGKGCSYEGESKGHISLKIRTLKLGDSYFITQVDFPITVKIVPKPPKHKRILWDQFHNLQYPPGYIPRDNLRIKSDPLDWRSDHIHTNFRDMYQHLRDLGYYIETLGVPYTCFNASNYGVLLIVDPEEEFFNEEIYKLQDDVFENGLSVIVFADWYNSSVMSKMKFYDENTREWWIPDTGGSNIPALNDMLQAFGISLSDKVVEGYFRLGEHNMYYASGSTLGQFPSHSDNIIISANLNDQAAEIIKNVSISPGNKKKEKYPIIGLFQMQQTDKKQINIPRSFKVIDTANDFFGISNIDITNPILNKRVLLQSSTKLFRELNKKIANLIRKPFSEQNENKLGRVVVMGDSNCIDSTFADKYCLWLLKAFLEYTMNSYKSPLLKKLNTISKFKNRQKYNNFPTRIVSSRLYKFSKVVKHDNNLKKKNLQLCEKNVYNKPIYLNSSKVEIK
ncbi:membrane-bound transcription factor site-1 protease isoform 2-T2 [Cochliomyia hominivorax]